MSSDRRSLEALLAPLSPEAFLREYWQRKPLHLRSGAEKASDVFDRGAFDRAVAASAAAGVSLRASSDSLDDERTPGMHFPIRPEDVAGCLERGATICADPVDRADPGLAEWAGAIKRALHFTGSVDVKAYLSSPGHGFNTHFDRNVALTLQVAGRKRWTFGAEPAVPSPTHNALLALDGSIRYVGRATSELEPWELAPPIPESQRNEVVLEPGDVLCLPAGTWHRAKALDESLAINLSFRPLPVLDFLRSVLEQRLRGRVEWRRGLPAFVGDGGEGAGPSDALRRVLGERVRELRDLLGGLDASDSTVLDAWRRAVSRSEAPPDRPPAFAAVEPHAAARPDPGAGGSSEHEGFESRMTFTLGVRDLDVSIRWYEDLLGFRLSRRIDVVGWCELETHVPGASIGLYTQAEGAASAGSVTLAVRDLEAVRARLGEKGVRFDGAVREIPGRAKLATVLDPDGNRIVLAESL